MVFLTSKNALEILRKWMFSLNFIILKNNNLFFDGISNDELHLAMFRYKKEDENEIRNAHAGTLEALNKILETETSYTCKSSAAMSICFSHDENLLSLTNLILICSLTICSTRV